MMSRGKKLLRDRHKKYLRVNDNVNIIHAHLKAWCFTQEYRSLSTCSNSSCHFLMFFHNANSRHVKTITPMHLIRPAEI